MRRAPLLTGERILWRLVAGDFHWCGAMPLWLVVRVLDEEPAP